VGHVAFEKRWLKRDVYGPTYEAAVRVDDPIIAVEPGEHQYEIFE
jgi:hypothetical protein